MLGLGSRTGEEVAELGRDIDRRGGGRAGRRQVPVEGGGIAAGENPAGLLVSRSPRVGKAGAGGVPDEDLPGVGGLLEESDGRGTRTGDEELPMRGPYPEDVDRPREDAHRGAEVDATGGGGPPSGGAQGRPHGDRRRHRPGGVILTDEEEEKGVTPEGEDIAPALLGESDHGTEHVVEDVGELLGSHPAAAGQTLGEGCEPGDVDETEGAVDDLPRTPRRLLIPAGGEGGDVRSEAGRCLHHDDGARLPAVGFSGGPASAGLGQRGKRRRMAGRTSERRTMS